MNDANPESIKYLKESIKLNKMKVEEDRIFNLDAKEILQDLPSCLKAIEVKNKNLVLIMNIPGSSREFLKGLLSCDQEKWEQLKAVNNFSLCFYWFDRKQSDENPLVVLKEWVLCQNLNGGIKIS